MQVYTAVQRAAALQRTPPAHFTAQASMEAQIPDNVCISSSTADEDPKQCKASQPIEVPVLVSGAGHDSLAMAELTQASVAIATACCDLSSAGRRLTTA